MSYLSAPKSPEGCIFCHAADAEPSPESLVLGRGERVLAMLNRYPYSNGHVMIAPLEHCSNLYDSAEGTLKALISAAARAQRILADAYAPEGFNLGMNFGSVAGAGFAEHYHLHLVPRWGGDHNFMSITAGTRMIPEELPATWEKLSPKFRLLSSSF